MKKMLIMIVMILLLGSLGAYLLLTRNNTSASSYGCGVIMTEIDSCWASRNASSGNIIECWNAPLDSTNTCATLENTNTYRDYEQCDSLRIDYYPPSRLAGFNNSEEGLVLFECPTM